MPMWIWNWLIEWKKVRQIFWAKKVEVEIERNAFVEYITALISQHPVQGLETRNLIQIPNRGLYVLRALPLQWSPLLSPHVGSQAHVTELGFWFHYDVAYEERNTMGAKRRGIETLKHMFVCLGCGGLVYIPIILLTIACFLSNVWFDGTWR